MILYLKGLTDFPPKFLGVINTFSKVTRYKTNMQKLVAFLYNNEITEDEIS